MSDLKRVNLRRKWSTIPKQQVFNNQPSRFTVWPLFVFTPLRLKIPLVLVRFDHMASVIINAKHSIV